jgi:hypothetical protein
LAGLNAWFSTIHIPDGELPGVLAEFYRVLNRRRPEMVAAMLTEAGFHILVTMVHEPVGTPAKKQGAFLIALKGK